jgi:hypothetical protein
VTEVVVKDKSLRDLLKRLVDKTEEISQRSRDYTVLMSGIAFQDIQEHFQKQMGPNGKWQAWSERYRKRMIRIGKGGNLILQDTGRLKGGFLPTNTKAQRQGILWVNRVKYAATHDKGDSSRNIPPRTFTWLSDKAMKKMSKQTLLFILKE